MQAEELIEPLDDKFHISADAVNSDERVNVLNHSNTFAIFDRWGNIYPQGKMVQGIYHEGTRFINRLVLAINGKKPLLLSSAIKEENDILAVDLTNPFLETCNILDNTIHISRNQFIRESAYYEEIACIFYGEKECSFELTLSFDGDFKDLFEIRGIQRQVDVNKVIRDDHDNCCKLQYEGLDGIKRQTSIYFTSEADYTLKGNQARFSIKLSPNKPVVIRYCIHFIVGDRPKSTTSYLEAKKSIQSELNNSRSVFATILTSNEQFNHWIKRSQVDLLSLLAQTQQGKYPYAGVPWYNTPFGRDGLITAIQTLWLAPEISRDVLLFLARNQATELIPEKDAEPGKILHEARTGEMANTGEVPFKQYYGTIDATPLFVMLAGMYYERTADLEFIKKIWANIKDAVKWIDEYGDLDGDGFVEYKHKAKNGLTNQGWKDSFDSIMYEDGHLAEPAIALCEVQGYVYSAKCYAGKLAKVFVEEDLSKQLLEDAETLKKNFNAKFWDDELSCFVLALDGQKRPCRVISSNAGHCLFTQIADEDKAKKLADVLLGSDMFSGWGIRTLSANEERYNPMSYHNGSIWPHDNALIAYGLSLYGFQDHVLKIMKAIFEASLFIELQRMPELYCGFNRKAGIGPTDYPVACSPQAWSVAVVFMLLQACLRIDINVLTKTITFDRPLLPEYLEKFHISDLTLNSSNCNLTINRLPNDVGFNLLQKPEDWQVIIKK
ncbi:glycogen debranching N-terminal domain-containing protein [Rubrolithibacter danxiaensis]|uniref:amylo-alpha-1,6-glucosidase n=1 Tax=Rubrolithibacter danxiaensis TaxID=3390805 RepID=UPI003BF8431B